MASLGDSLREEREARNISLEEIASATKIIPRYLEALETDRLDLMPGGFFIKAIIRSYARAVGLDPEEIVERYRAAGVLEPPEPPKGIFARRPTPAPVRADQPAAAAPGPAETPVPAEETAVEIGHPGQELFIEEAAAKPGPDRSTRKQLLYWGWRAAVLVVAVAVLVWSPWRRHPAPAAQGSTAVQTRPPASKPAESLSAPALTLKSQDNAPATAEPKAPPTGVKPPAEAAIPTVTEQAAPKPEAAAPAPAGEEVWKGITIEIVFEAETWIQVYTDGDLRIGGLFPAGASARAQANEKLLIHTGNAGGFTFKLNGRKARPLGRSGQVLTDIKITLQNLKDFLEASSSGGPTG